LQGTAAIRREAGHHRAVNDVLILHDPLAKTGNADIHHRQDEAIGHFGILGRLGPGLRRLAIFPLVNSLAGLMAKLSRLDLSAQPVRHRRHRPVELCFQRFRNGKTDVETDPIRQFDWTDRHAEPLGGSIDGFGWHFLVEQQHRLEHVGGQRTIHEEARVNKFADYLPTSAKRGDNCSDSANGNEPSKLKQLIARHIPWERLPWTSTPRLLAEIKNAVMAMRDEADIRLLRFAELARRLEQALPNTKIREADVRTAVTLLANHGLLRPLKFGDLVLLRPDLLNGYASGHPRGPRASGRNRLRRGRIDLP
jgi:hypothetical protein